MTVTASQNLRLKIISDYSEEDLWGGHTNDNLNRIDEAIRGVATYAVQTGVSEYTLPEQDYTGGSAHKPIIKITGAQDTNLDVILPARPQGWIVINNSSDGGGGPYEITFKTASGNGVAFGHGDRGLVAGDGTDVIGIISPGSFLRASNNLSDIENISTAQSNLQLSGALIDSNNLNDVASAATARANLEINASLIESLLQPTGVVVGTYNGITFDAKGRATAANSIQPVFTMYESAYASIQLNSVYTYTHGLSDIPNFNFIIWLNCIVADGGYAVGEKIPLAVSPNTIVIEHTIYHSQPKLWLPNTTQIKIRTPNSFWHLGQPSGGEQISMTPSRWQMKVSASRFN